MCPTLEVFGFATGVLHTIRLRIRLVADVATLPLANISSLMYFMTQLWLDSSAIIRPAMQSFEFWL